MKAMMQRLLLIFATLALAGVLWQFRHPLFLLLVAIALAAALRPLAVRFQARGIPQPLTIAIFYLLVIGVLIGAAALASSALSSELTRLSNDLVFAYERLVILARARARSGSDFFASLPRAGEVAGFLEDRSLLAASADLVEFTGQGLAALAALGFAIVLSISWAAEGESIVRLGLSALKVRSRQRVEALWRAIEDRVGATIRHAAVESIALMLIFAALYSLMGLRYPILLALFGAGAALFPWLGPVLHAIVLLLAGSIGGVQLHVLAALLSILIYLGVHRALTNHEDRRWLPDPLLMVISLLLLTHVYGPIGVLFAGPLASIVHALLLSLFTLRAASEEESRPDATLAEIETRFAELRQKVEDQKMEQDKLLTNLVSRFEASLRDVQNQRAGGPAE